MKQVTALIILDGFGYSTESKHNAIALAHTPHIDRWMHEYPHAFLQAAGPAVGFPSGYIGSSEAGHKTIGAGRRIREPLTKINDAIESGDFFQQELLVSSFKELASSGKTLHIWDCFRMQESILI